MAVSLPCRTPFRCERAGLEACHAPLDGNRAAERVLALRPSHPRSLRCSAAVLDCIGDPSEMGSECRIQVQLCGDGRDPFAP